VADADAQPVTESKRDAFAESYGQPVAESFSESDRIA
jgi:hypothetical protein